MDNLKRAPSTASRQRSMHASPSTHNTPFFNLTLTVLVDRYLRALQTDYAPKTIKNHRYTLAPFVRGIGHDYVTDIKLWDVEEYLINKKDMQSSISTTKGVFRQFFQWCEQSCEIQLSFNWQAIKKKKVSYTPPTIFTKENVQQVVSACKDYQDALLISLLFYTGMRISEALNLQLRDINGTQIRVRGKGSYDRVVHMPRKLAGQILGYCTDGYVFKPLQKQSNHPEERYVSAYGVRDRIQREFLNTLGKKMKPHDLRHSFAVAYLMAGGDLRSLQLILGHASLETTQWYLQFSDSQTGKIYAKVFG